tara:strand:+ start:336 stop:542 length:207 start_codon:yes stop_codon:yes gene_type:complete
VSKILEKRRRFQGREGVKVIFRRAKTLKRVNGRVEGKVKQRLNTVNIYLITKEITGEYAQDHRTYERG